MQFHLPKPLHGWREFFGEVGIIVLGVMIALGAGQAIENWRSGQTLKETEIRLRAELGVNLANAYERLTITECLTGRIIDLRDKLTTLGNDWTADHVKLAQDVYIDAFPAVYRSPGRTWAQEAWHTATNNDGLNYAPAEQVSQLASHYSSVAQMKQV